MGNLPMGSPAVPPCPPCGRTHGGVRCHASAEDGRATRPNRTKSPWGKKRILPSPDRPSIGSPATAAMCRASVHQGAGSRQDNSSNRSASFLLNRFDLRNVGIVENPFDIIFDLIAGQNIIALRTTAELVEMKSNGDTSCLDIDVRHARDESRGSCPQGN